MVCRYYCCNTAFGSYVEIYVGVSAIALFLLRTSLVRKAKTNIGTGLRTTQACSVGDVLFVVHGKIRHYTFLLAHPGTIQDNAFRFSSSTYLSPEGELGDYLNHSCEPNARVIKQDRTLLILARSNIPKGREVTIDYSTILAADDVWRMRCACASKACRTIIRSYAAFPKSLKARYLAEGLIPDYILGIRG